MNSSVSIWALVASLPWMAEPPCTLLDKTEQFIGAREHWWRRVENMLVMHGMPRKPLTDHARRAIGSRAR